MPFRQIAGHRHLLERLAHALANGTLPPSLIFSGAQGVGKRTAALALAQALNCERPLPWPDDAGRDACGECGACRRIARGVHADLVIVTPARVARSSSIRSVTPSNGPPTGHSKGVVAS